MVNSFFNEMQQIATGVLAEFAEGKIEYVDIVPGNGPKDNPGPPTITYRPLDGVARGVKFKYIQSSLAVAGQLQATVSVPDFTMNMNGKIRVDGAKEHKITAMQPIPPVGTPVAIVIIFGDANPIEFRKKYV